MTDYLIRTGEDGMVTDLMERGEDEPAECDGDCDCCPIDCDKCDQLEVVMVAFMKDFREKLAVLERRIEQLENRPILEAESLFPPWVVTCNTTSQIDPDMLSKTITNSIYKAMRT